MPADPTADGEPTPTGPAPTGHAPAGPAATSPAQIESARTGPEATEPALTGHAAHEGEPVDPDVDLHIPAQRREVSPAVLAAIAVGGGLGGLARYAFAGLGLPGTIAVNVVGSALIGVLMVLVPRLHPLARPFLGVGVLGGFTTFSAYALDAVKLGGLGAVLYLAGTLLLALSATALGMTLTRKVLG